MLVTILILLTHAEEVKPEMSHDHMGAVTAEQQKTLTLTLRAVIVYM